MIIKTAISLKAAKEALMGSKLKEHLARFSNGHLTTKRMEATMLDKAKNLLSTKEGAKALASAPGVKGAAGAGVITGAAVLAYKKKKK